MHDMAQALSVPVTYAYELARRRDIPAVKLGKYVRVPAAEFGQWLDGLRAAACDSIATSPPDGFSSPPDRPVERLRDVADRLARNRHRRSRRPT
jgi:excisionase family DNA binding protein